ncbi:MAG: PLP-dependent aminotransferase family protein [Gammaproteobacteria bacterium]|nr:MAG: PLP-dependent aminotransferase family protein [Gammaproteobacteria bacterium]
MDHMFSSRIKSVQPSFIREILKAAENPDVISFAGGLPDKNLFPVKALTQASVRLMEHDGRDILQYGQSEGEYALRSYISEYYRSRQQLNVPVENILITSGSQQGLDLLGKVLIDQNDRIVIESPGYLGAIQALSLYQPEFLPVDIEDNGLDLDGFERSLSTDPKLLYCVPNFQNPTGYSYSEDNKKSIVDLVKDRNMFIVEDDPYGEICFSGENASSFFNWLPDQSILLGTFSKTISPGLRVGWIVAPDEVMKKLIIAKQASDLHTSRLTQGLILEYLLNNDLQAHLDQLSRIYGERCRIMGDLLDQHLGDEIERSHPRGGMFMWVKFAEPIDTMALFDAASSRGVVFVPGQSFYTDSKSSNCMRLNFSCSNQDQLAIGIERLCRAYLESRQADVPGHSKASA